MTVLSLPEYGLVQAASDGGGPKEQPSAVVLRAKDFEALEHLLAQLCTAKPQHPGALPTDIDDDDGAGENKLPFIYDTKIRKALRVQNYAGIVLLPSGDSLEILPKITKNMDQDGRARGRKILLRMLAALWQLPEVTLPDANLSTGRMPLLEVFITCFLKEIGLLIRRGICSGYTPIEENSPCLCGRLLLPQHIRANSVHRERFYVRYDEYLPDRPENRLVKSALLRAYILSKNHDNKRRCKQFLETFEDVPASVNIRADVFASTRLDRNIRHYRTSLFWSRLLLLGQTPVPTPGDLRCTAMFFPMEKLFEAYVTQQVRKKLGPQGWQITPQAQSRHLIEYHGNGGSYSLLKPDLLLERKEERVVADMKWKNIESKKTISTADLYQLFAYSEKYLPRLGSIPRKSFLLYPWTDAFQDGLPPFHFYKDTAVLHAVPYNLETDECPLFDLLGESPSA